MAFNAATPLLGAALSAIFLFSPAAHSQSNTKAITIVLPEEPDVLDGCNAQGSSQGRVIYNTVVEGLTQIDTKTGALAPRLATSWQQLNDLTWRFNLRKGIVFHDGAPFNAEAARVAIVRTLDPKLHCSNYTRYFGDVTITPKIVDEYTIDLVTGKPTPILPTYLAWLAITSPNTPMDKQVLFPVGTGPYSIDKFVPGQQIDTKRNDKWWGPKPQVEAVKYIWRVESSVRAAMVKVGEADLASEIAQQEVKPAEATFRDVSYPNAETAHLRIETTFPPLDDRRVRVAMNLAVDRESLKGSIFPKEVTMATNMVVQGVSGYNPNIKPWPYDPAQARKLIAEAKAAGVPVDKEILLVGRTNLYPNSTESMEALLSMWKAVGLNTKISMLEVGNWQKWNVKPFPENRGPNLLQTRHNNQSGDLEFSAFAQWACGGSRSGICDKSLDERIAQAIGMTGDARLKAWQEVAREVYEDKVTNVFLFHLIGFARIGSRINYVPDFLTTGAIDVASITFR